MTGRSNEWSHPGGAGEAPTPRRLYGDLFTTPMGSGIPPVTPIGVREHDRPSVEAEVESEVQRNLESWINNTWSSHHDEIFEAFTGYTLACAKNDAPHRAARLWTERLAPLVAGAEGQLAGHAAGHRIHQGSPLYNVGLCHFLAGDYDSACQFLGEAGRQDELSGVGNPTDLLLGRHDLSEQILIAPAARWVVQRSGWRDPYYKVTGRLLGDVEFRELLRAASHRPEDAIELLRVVHTFARVEDGPANTFRLHSRARAAAGMAVVAESTLRAFQQELEGKQLHDRLADLLNANQSARQAFDGAHARFTAQFPRDPTTRRAHPDKESFVGFDWSVRDALSRLSSAAGTADQAGTAAYLAVRVRNSLAHSIDHRANLYQSDTNLEQVAGLLLGVLRIIQDGRIGTLSHLH